MRFVGVLATALLSVLSILFVARLQEGLREPVFITGWCVALVIAALAIPWWRKALDGPRLAARLRIHVHIAWIATLLLFLHIDFRVPNGWLDIASFALFFAMLISLCIGMRILGRATPDEEPDEDSAREVRGAATWVFGHVFIVYALFGLGLFHGLFVHGHGMLAHLFLDR